MGIDSHGPSCAVAAAELNQEVGKVWDPDTAELNFLELYDGDKSRCYVPMPELHATH